MPERSSRPDSGFIQGNARGSVDVPPVQHEAILQRWPSDPDRAADLLREHSPGRWPSWSAICGTARDFSWMTMHPHGGSRRDHPSDGGIVEDLRRRILSLDLAPGDLLSRAILQPAMASVRRRCATRFCGFG